jgi:hypothetical protein
MDLLSPSRQATEPSPFSYRTLEMLAALAGDDRRAQAVNNGHITSTVLQVIQMLSEWTPSWEEKEEERKRAGAATDTHLMGTSIKGPQSVLKRGGLGGNDRKGGKGARSGHDSDEEDGDDFMFLRPTPTATSTLSGGNHGSSVHGSSHSVMGSEADEYERLPPSERIAVVMTSLGRFIQMMVRFPSTAAELVRSNSLIILFKMAVATGAISAVPAVTSSPNVSAIGLVGMSNTHSVSPSIASATSPSATLSSGDIISASEWQFRDAAQQLGRSCLLALISGRPAEDLKTAGYLHRTGCLRILLESLRRPHELGGPTSVVDLCRVIVKLVQHAGVSTPQLLTDVNEAEAYDILFDCALWLAALAEPLEQSQDTAESKLVARSAEAALSGLLKLLNHLTFVGPDILQLPPDHSAPANHMGRSEFEEMGARVRNLNAFRVLQFSFVRIASPMVRMDILNRVLMIFSSHPGICVSLLLPSMLHRSSESMM